jgi:cytochrome oxidase Cu insertion factor (SCO1/SenC/PrrC family)
MGRWLATLAIAALLMLDLALPVTGVGRRGNESAVRAEATSAAPLLGEPFPGVTLTLVDGRTLRTEDLHGHATLLVFERSVDW